MEQEFKPYNNVIETNEDGSIIRYISDKKKIKHKIREGTNEHYITYYGRVSNHNKKVSSTVNVKNVVYKAWNGRFDNKFKVIRIDGNPTNNHYKNLTLQTKKGAFISLDDVKDHEEFIGNFYVKHFIKGNILNRAKKYMPDMNDEIHSVALNELFIAISTFDGKGNLELFCLGRIRMKLMTMYRNYKYERTADIDAYKEILGGYQMLHDDTDEFVEQFCEILTDNQKEFLLAMYRDENLSLRQYADKKGVTPQSLSKVRRQLQKKYFLFLQGVDIKEESNRLKSIAKSIGVIKRDDRGKVVAEYTSIMDCCRFENIKQTTLRNHLDTGKLFNGYYWERRE